MNSDSLLPLFDYIAPILNYGEPIMKNGEGSYIYDVEGKKYLDFNCGQFCSVFGHSNPKLAEVVYKSAKKLVHLNTGTVSDEMLIAAKKIHDICPEMNGRVMLLSTGGEANECALRYAKNMSGNKSGIVSFDMGYHGLSHGTEGYSMSRKWVKPSLDYSYVVNVPKVVSVDNKMEMYSYVKEFEDIVRSNSENIAAAIFEPIVSSGGLYFPPKEYWREIRRICTENNIYLILDECQTGFGRTGTWFYYQQIDCVPDILVCAKSMGLGYPISMVVFNGNTIPREKFTMHHFSSHQNEPFSASVVSFAIDEIENECMLDKIREKGNCLLNKLNDIAIKYSKFISNPRGIGLMCGFDINTDKMTKEQIIQQGDLFCKHALENNIIIQCANYGKTIRLLPSYYTTGDEIDFFISALDKTIEHFFSNIIDNMN